MNRDRILFLIALLLLVLSLESNAFSARSFQKQSPVPSPSPYPQPSSRRSAAPAPVPGIPPTGPSTDSFACLGTCNISDIITVCLKRSQTDSDQLLVFISNSGQSSPEVNVTVSVINYLKEMNIAEQETKQINLTTNFATNFTVEVDTGDEKCKIPYIVLPTYDDSYSNPETLRKHSYGIYLLVVFVALIIGCCMASCYKLGEKKRLDGIRYKELEMQQPDSAPANGSFEVADNWGDWDDKWDESEKPLNLT